MKREQNRHPYLDFTNGALTLQNIGKRGQNRPRISANVVIDSNHVHSARIETIGLVSKELLSTKLSTEHFSRQSTSMHHCRQNDDYYYNNCLFVCVNRNWVSWVGRIRHHIRPIIGLIWCRIYSTRWAVSMLFKLVQALSKVVDVGFCILSICRQCKH